MAKEMGISRAMFYDMKSGKVPVSEKTLRKLSELEGRAGVFPVQTPNALGMSQPGVAGSGEACKAGEEFAERFVALWASLPESRRAQIADRFVRMIINEVRSDDT